MNQISNDKDNFFQGDYTINCRGKLINLSTPLIMGIINITPDSFYSGSRFGTVDEALLKTESMIRDGAAIIDIGAASSRPNSEILSEEDELNRLIPILKNIRKSFPDVLISVDTWRSNIVHVAANEGADIINDISGGSMDLKIIEAVSKNKMPYILMHMQGTPQSMQANPKYQNITKELITFFSFKINELMQKGVRDIIIDPGFGFGKTIEQNYELFNKLEYFKIIEKPLLVGISRKSMIFKLLNTHPEEALNGTTVLNTLAVLKGAKILRVHDVKECAEVIKICAALNKLNQSK